MSGQSRLRIIANKPGPWSVPPEVMVLAPPAVDCDAPSWDIMRERLLVPYTPYFQPGERRDHVLLPHLPQAVMVVQTERTVGFHGGFPIVELTSYGLAQRKPWKIVTSQSSTGDIGTPGGVLRDLPTINCYWFSATLEGTKIYIPSAATPPETFGWPANKGTTGLPNNFGWYIIRRDVEPLPIITGTTDPKPYTGGSSGSIRTDANLAPQPSLCSVVDYYMYDVVDTLPPGT